MIVYKQCLLITCTGLIFGALSPNFWYLTVSYLITGFGIGGSFAVDGSVFLEYLHSDHYYLIIGLAFLSPIFSAVPPALQ